MRKLTSSVKRKYKADILSIAAGYTLSILCVALSISLYYQEQGALTQEESNYTVRTGTRVIIDLRNGRVYERAHKAPVVVHADTPDKTADIAASSKDDKKTQEEAASSLPDVPPPSITEPVSAETTAARYAKSAKETDFRENGAPVLAIVIKGVGMSAASTDAAIAMPAAVNIGFSPYATSLAADASRAAAKGHDILLHLPMETGDLNRHDPGPYSLLSGLSAEENLRRLSIVSALTVRYAGVYTGEKENFSVIPSAFAPVMAELNRRGIPMIYGGGHSRLSFFQNTTQAGYPVIGADIHIDTAFDKTAIAGIFNAILKRANEHGFATVMVSPYPVTINLIHTLVTQAEKSGIRIKPASYFFKKLYVDESTS